MTNSVDVQEMVLDNGFRALLVERRTLPVVASMVWYRVGARDERAGETGLSHFLEHMMFQGDRSLRQRRDRPLDGQDRGQQQRFYRQRYHRVLLLPSLRIAGRPRSRSRRAACAIVCSMPTSSLPRKNVVLDELAMGEDDPWRSLYQAVDSLAFQVHPYHHPVIGWKDDVAGVSVESMREYYQRHYAPDRAFMVAVGDFDAGRLRTRIEDLFAPHAPSGLERGCRARGA